MEATRIKEEIWNFLNYHAHSNFPGTAWDYGILFTDCNPDCYHVFHWSCDKFNQPNHVFKFVHSP